MSFEVLGVCAALLSVFALIGLAIYKARHDPHPFSTRREVVRVLYADADAMLKRNEGWQLAPEEDYNRERGWVYLERFVQPEESQS